MASIKHRHDPHLLLTPLTLNDIATPPKTPASNSLLSMLCVWGYVSMNGMSSREEGEREREEKRRQQGQAWHGMVAGGWLAG